MTFGEIISKARKDKGLSLKGCASLIVKEDGVPISFQYLSDIENGKRSPTSEHFLEQVSKVLDIPIELLYFHVEKIPSYVNKSTPQEQVVSAYKNFLKLVS